ncbi:MAG TPA: DUF3352 domain-containing protein [Acidimicrobiales bacterium]|nr:DUF3352 domain-containing protein [Acidimicrobiales bacterium]
MKRLLAVAAGVLLLALPACGQKTDETNRAAGITPKDAVAFLDFNLSPSIEQQRNLLSVARRLPGTRAKVRETFEDARDELIAEALRDTGLDYGKDVKPWLGDEVAVAALPRAGGSPELVYLVQTHDADAAEAAIAKASAHGGFAGRFAVVDGFVVVSDQVPPSDNAAVLARVAATAKKDDGGLAATPGFAKLVDQLHGDRLVLGWASTRDVLAQRRDRGGVFGGLIGGLLSTLDENGGPTAVDLHAEKQAVVAEGVTTIDPSGGKTSSLELTRSLPASTLAAVTFVGDKVPAGALAKLPAGATSFTKALGFDPRADILPWAGGESVLVVGPIRPGRRTPDLALVVQPTDAAKAQAGVAKIHDLLAGRGLPVVERQVAGTTAYVAALPFQGFQPAMGLFPGRFVLASSPEFLGDLAKPASPDLASTSGYRAAVGTDQEGTTFQVVVLIDRAREAMEALGLTDPARRAHYEKDVKPNLEPLDAFGVRSHHDGGYSRFEARLTFD